MGPQLTDNSSTEEAALVNAFDRYKAMEILKSYAEADRRI